MFTILLVEDDKSFRETIEELLTFEGYSIISCGDGETALQYMREYRLHLIITDILIPKLTGLELLNHIRTNASIPFLPVIFMTGRTDQAVEEISQEAGVSALIHKPFLVKEFLSIIAGCLAIV